MDWRAHSHAPYKEEDQTGAHQEADLLRQDILTQIEIVRHNLHSQINMTQFQQLDDEHGDALDQLNEALKYTEALAMTVLMSDPRFLLGLAQSVQQQISHAHQVLSVVAVKSSVQSGHTLLEMTSGQIRTLQIRNDERAMAFRVNRPGFPGGLFVLVMPR